MLGAANKRMFIDSTKTKSMEVEKVNSQTTAGIHAPAVECVQVLILELHGPRRTAVVRLIDRELMRSRFNTWVKVIRIEP
jgi:hypothetical protein